MSLGMNWKHREPPENVRGSSFWNSVGLTLQGSADAHAVQELNKAIDRAEGLLLQ